MSPLGVQLGNPKIAERNGAVADAYAEGLREVVAPLARLPERPARAIAAALNDRGIRTTRGGEWRSMTGTRLLDRLGL